MELRINNRLYSVPPEWRAESLLSVLREQLGLVGAKFGCGVGLCGACSVLLDGQAQRSCLSPRRRSRSPGARSRLAIAPRLR